METDGANSEIRSHQTPDPDGDEENLMGDQKNETSVQNQPKFLSEAGKKSIIGVVIVIFLAVSWVGAQQLAQDAVRLHTFDAPYFTTWFSTCWMTLCFPCYLIFVALSERSKDGFMENLRKSSHLFGQKRVTMAQFFKIIWSLNVVWLAVNYLYIFGLKFIYATDASAIMASNVAFVYMLSLCLLREKVYVIRIAASALCIIGVVLFGYAEGFQGSDDMLKGVLMIIASAFGAAVYKVVFKKVVGDATLGQVSLYLTLLGISNILLMWTVSLILYKTGAEDFYADDIPWNLLVYSSTLSLVFNFLVNFGIAYTYPLFISVAMMLGIPLNAGVDVIRKQAMFSPLRLVAAVLVFSGFVIMLFPDSWNDPIHSLIRCKKGSKGNNGEDLGSGRTVQESLLLGDSHGDLPLEKNKKESSREESV